MRHRLDERLDQNFVNSTEILPPTSAADDPDPGKSAPQHACNDQNIVVIERRLLLRECLDRCIKLMSGHSVISLPTVESWLRVADITPASLIVLCGDATANVAETHSAISLLSQSANLLPVIVLSEIEDPQQIVQAIDNGARGYIPTSIPLQVAIEAIHLVQAGGVFVPASSLIAATRVYELDAPSKETSSPLFTPRQTAVVAALRQGKANKIIAHELNMRESTVKVHVRNIMKKLRARNRTEVAFMTSSLGQTQTG
jgi:DNA-binding NarL/FixJ family response regulator